MPYKFNANLCKTLTVFYNRFDPMRSNRFPNINSWINLVIQFTRLVDEHCTR